MKRIGFDAGESFDIKRLDPSIRSALATVPEDAQKLMQWKTPAIARVVNGWSMNTDTMGVYGNYYLKRAIVTQLGLGANLPEDAIYSLNFGDDTGKPLDGANNYVLHFDKGQTPPVEAFWSVTLYDPEGFQVANSLNRFAVSSWMPFKYNADGETWPCAPSSTDSTATNRQPVCFNTGSSLACTQMLHLDRHIVGWREA